MERQQQWQELEAGPAGCVEDEVWPMHMVSGQCYVKDLTFPSQVHALPEDHSDLCSRMQLSHFEMTYPCSVIMPLLPATMLVQKLDIGRRQRLRHHDPGV